MSMYKILVRYLVLISLALMCAGCGPGPAGGAPFDDVQRLGRYAETGDGGLKMGWPGSGIAVRFRGKAMSITITDDGRGVMDVIINGKESALPLVPGMRQYSLVSSETASLYDVTVTRRTEAQDTGLFTIGAIDIDGEIVARSSPARKILFIGDSITAGYGVRGNHKACRYSPASNAPHKAYALLAAKALDAQAHLVAISGRGVIRNYDDASPPLMPAQLDWALPDTEQPWDHRRFMPGAVVIALGTNDWSQDRPQKDEDWQAEFKAAYAELIAQARARFPKAHVIAMTGPMLSGDNARLARQAVEAIAAESADPLLSAFDASLSDTLLKWGCDYHPGRDSMRKMAAELSGHIAEAAGWDAAPIAARRTLKISPPSEMRAGGKTHYKMRVEALYQTPPLSGGALFIGDSITEGADWASAFEGVATVSQGIAWDIVSGVRARIMQSLIHDPDTIFIKIGTNDIGYNHDPSTMAETLEGVLRLIAFRRPDTRVYLQSVMPREAENAAAVAAINAEYKALASRMQVEYIDLHPWFADEHGAMKAALTTDQIHLSPQGYAVWADALRPFVSPP